MSTKTRPLANVFFWKQYFPVGFRSRRWEIRVRRFTVGVGPVLRTSTASRVNSALKMISQRVCIRFQQIVVLEFKFLSWQILYRKICGLSTRACNVWIPPASFKVKSPSHFSTSPIRRFPGWRSGSPSSTKRFTRLVLIKTLRCWRQRETICCACGMHCNSGGFLCNCTLQLGFSRTRSSSIFAQSWKSSTNQLLTRHSCAGPVVSSGALARGTWRH